MNIIVVGQNGEAIFPFTGSGPWEEFKDEVIKRGHEITSLNSNKKFEVLISHNHSKRALKKAKKNRVPISHRVMVLWEPHVVLSKNYSRRILKEYGHVYAPSPLWASRINGKSFNWPQDKVKEIEGLQEWSGRNNRFAIIQGNKFSVIPGEQYSYRRRVLMRLSDYIDLYGQNWNQGLGRDLWAWIKSAITNFPSGLSINSLFGIGMFQKNYQGCSDNKIATYSKYRFAIVIENSVDFISEKLFDAVSAGCLVVYVGPSLDLFRIDSGPFCFDSSSENDVYKACTRILNLTESEQFSLAKAQNEALLSVSQMWENSIVLRNLAERILSDISSEIN